MGHLKPKINVQNTFILPPIQGAQDYHTCFSSEFTGLVRGVGSTSRGERIVRLPVLPSSHSHVLTACLPPAEIHALQTP